MLWLCHCCLRGQSPYKHRVHEEKQANAGIHIHMTEPPL